MSEQADIQIMGDNNCLDCDIVWSPSLYLNDSTVPYPIILGSRNVLALDTSYQDSVMNELGCRAIDTVNAYTILERFSVDGEITEDYCSYQMTMNVDIPENIGEIFYTVYFRNETTGERFEGELSQKDGLRETYKRSFLKKDVTNGIWIAVLEVEDIFSTNCGEFVAAIGETEQTELFFGPYRFAMPDGFTPNADRNNDTFYPVGWAFETVHNMNAYRARLRIFDRYGKKIYEKEVWASDVRQSIDGRALEWNGYFNGRQMPSDAYLYDLFLENCDNHFQQGGDCEKICYYDKTQVCNEDSECPGGTNPDGEFESGDCLGCEFKGDLTLIR